MTWTVEDRTDDRWLTWVWNEHDGPPPTLPTREGFGLRLINRILAAQTGAEVEVAADADGLRISIGLPVPNG